MLYLCFFKPLRDHLRGFLIAAWAGDKIAEFSFPEISFYFPLRPWFFFVSPAYAGKSSCLWWRKWPCRDHPRVCGEKPDSRNTLQLSPGSPPHVRGKALAYLSPCTERRITPACAGKSFLRSSSQSRSGDHPRVCGEKVYKDIKHVAAVGSPPRMRGKVRIPCWRSVSAGITPAYAGKRTS